MLTDEQAEQLKTQCLQLIVASQELQEQLTAANQTISHQSTIIEQLAKDNLTSSGILGDSVLLSFKKTFCNFSLQFPPG
jgi:hypothetical protein